MFCHVFRDLFTRHYAMDVRCPGVETDIDAGIDNLFVGFIGIGKEMRCPGFIPCSCAIARKVRPVWAGQYHPEKLRLTDV